MRPRASDLVTVFMHPWPSVNGESEGIPFCLARAEQWWCCLKLGHTGDHQDVDTLGNVHAQWSQERGRDA
jgi:hypothetical protein